MNTKTLKLLTLLLCSFVTICFFSCNDDDDNSETPETKLLPSIIKSYWGGAASPSFKEVYRFTYDDQNRFKNITMEYELPADGGSSTLAFAYTGDNIIVTSTYYAKPDEGDGPIVKTIVYEKRGNQVYINNADPILIDDNLRVAGRIYDENGNTTSYVNLSSQHLTVEHDGKNGVFRHVNMPAWYITSELHIITEGGLNSYNNCTTAMITSEMGGEKAPGYGYKMEYNELNYPTEITKDLINITANYFEGYEIEYIDTNRAPII